MLMIKMCAFLASAGETKVPPCKPNFFWLDQRIEVYKVYKKRPSVKKCDC